MVREVTSPSHSKKAGPTIEVRGIVKMARELEDNRVETYWTETVDVSAKGVDGKDFFHSFHVLAVPAGSSESLERVRRRFRESLKARLREAARRLPPEQFPVN